MSFAAAVLADLSRAFAKLGLRWYVFGAQAAIIYGSTRVTEDIDVTVELGDRTTSQLVSALRREGLLARVERPAEFMKRARVLPLLHRPTGAPVDVVLAGPGLEEMFLERVVLHTREQQSFPVASPEDVIVMKVLAGRPHDADDIMAIMRARAGSLDVEQIEQSLALLEEALGQGDLRRAFSTLTKAARKKKTRAPRRK